MSVPKSGDYNDVMAWLRTMCELRQSDDGSWTSWLVTRGVENDVLGLYGMSHADLHIMRRPDRDGLCHVMLALHSIDDCSAVLHGPTETEEVATRRVARLLDIVRGWGGVVPTREEFEKAAKQTGMYADYN